MRTKQIKRLLGAGLLAMVLLTGCAPQQTSDPVIHLGDLVEAEEQRVKEEKQAMIAEEAERLRLEYADGVYLEDYTEIREKLNRQLEEMLIPEVAQTVDFPVLTYLRIELYNSGYKEAKENDYDLQWILENKPELCKGIYGDIFFFMDGSAENIRQVYTERELCQETVEAVYELVPVDIWFRSPVFDLSVWENIDREELLSLSNENDVFKYLREHNPSNQYIYIMSNGTTFDYGSGRVRDLKDVESKLESKYDMDFRVIDTEKDRDIGNAFTFAPEDNLDMQFMADAWSDRFISMLSQKLVSERVNQIIEEEGASDYIAQFSSSKVSNTKSYDIEAILSNPDHYVEEVLSNADISFYYIKTPDEEVDYRKLIDVIAKSSLLLGEDKDVQAFAFIYEMDEIDRKKAIKLFKEAVTSENYFRDTAGMDTWIANRFVVNNQSDCFKFLESYGTAEDYVYRIGVGLRVGDSVGELNRVYKQRTIWGD